MLLKAFIMSLFCYGVFIASRPGMLLGGVAEWTKDHLKYFNKPVFGCIYCMSSLWGSAAYIMICFAMKEPINLFELLICVVCCATINKFLYNTLEAE